MVDNDEPLGHHCNRREASHVLTPSIRVTKMFPSDHVITPIIRVAEMFQMEEYPWTQAKAIDQWRVLLFISCDNLVYPSSLRPNEFFIEVFHYLYTCIWLLFHYIILLPSNRYRTNNFRKPSVFFVCF